MSVKLAYAGEIEYSNTKCILLTATFVGDYGTAGVGDLMDLNPSQNNGTDGGITDPNFAYNAILAQPPKIIGIINDNLSGYYTQVKPNATPSMTNFGLQVFASEGNELTTAEAYPAGVLAGNTTLIVGIPALQ
jgi:hypothetical protein